jgi:hypothetical protein
MTSSDNKMHAEHLKQAQDHSRWRREHLEALAILKQAEAALMLHEAQIVGHEAEIARHEEDVAHGTGHAAAADEEMHTKQAYDHAHNSEQHAGLLAAIKAVAAQLGGDQGT